MSHDNETINDEAMIGNGSEATHFVLRTSWMVANGEAQAIRLDREANEPPKNKGSTV